MKESGWDEAGNCIKCGEAGRCSCNNHYIKGFKGIRIKRIPFTSPMFRRYSPNKTEIYHATGKIGYGKLNAVGSLQFVVGLLIAKGC